MSNERLITEAAHHSALSSITYSERGKEKKKTHLQMKLKLPTIMWRKVFLIYIGKYYFIIRRKKGKMQILYHSLVQNSNSLHRKWLLSLNKRM